MKNKTSHYTLKSTYSKSAIVLVMDAAMASYFSGDNVVLEFDEKSMVKKVQREYPFTAEPSVLVL